LDLEMGNGKLILGPEDIGMVRPEMKSLVVHRKPIQIVCECKHEETIVLPLGSGLLLWKCHKCNQPWRFDFGPNGGQLAKAI